MLLEAMMLSDQFVPASLFFRANQLHTDFFRNDFSEKQVLCRVEGQKGKGCLVVLFPYKQGEERPRFAPWQGGDGLKISWKGETHYVLLDTHEHQIDSDVLKGKTSAVVVKLKGEKLASNRCSYHDGPLTGNAQ